jgi:PleD family two-component response regulator
MDKHKILIVEDDHDIGEMLRLYFDSHGYETSLATRGEDALILTRHAMPHLIVLDIVLPDMDGYAVCRTLRTSSRTSHIPVLFLTQKDERRDRIAGLELGADDYITKPFDIEELRLRVQNAIARVERDSMTDTCTGLPAGRIIEEYLRKNIRCKGWAMLDCRLMQFDAYRDAYGFIAADDALRQAARVFTEVIDSLGAPDDFIGHPGGDNFILFTEEERTAKIESALRARFVDELPHLYSYVDRQRGYVLVHDTAGTEFRRPLMRLSVGVLRSSQHTFTDFRQITEMAAEARRQSS